VRVKRLQNAMARAALSARTCHARHNQTKPRRCREDSTNHRSVAEEKGTARHPKTCRQPRETHALYEIAREEMPDAQPEMPDRTSPENRTVPAQTKRASPARSAAPVFIPRAVRRRQWVSGGRRAVEATVRRPRRSIPRRREIQGEERGSIRSPPPAGKRSVACTKVHAAAPSARNGEPEQCRTP